MFTRTFAEGASAMILQDSMCWHEVAATIMFNRRVTSWHSCLVVDSGPDDVVDVAPASGTIGEYCQTLTHRYVLTVPAVVVHWILRCTIQLKS